MFRPISPKIDRDYLRENLESALASERQSVIVRDYLDEVQKNTILPWMREAVLHWMTEVAVDYNYSSDAISLATRLFDSVLSVKMMRKSALQLVATGCLLIAIKYLEVEIPALQDLVEKADRAFSVSELKTIEMMILKTLSWQVGIVTPHTILRNVCELYVADNEMIKFDALFFLDFAFPFYENIRFPCSVLAVSSLFCAALKTSQKDAEALLKNLKESLTLDSIIIKECVLQILDLFFKTFSGHSHMLEHLRLYYDSHSSHSSSSLICAISSPPISPQCGKRKREIDPSDSRDSRRFSPSHVLNTEKI